MDTDFKDYNIFFEKLTDEEKDVLGDKCESCWVFAYFIHVKYGLPIQNYENEYEQYQDINNMNLNENGIYSYFMDHNTECHHFVLFVKDDKLILKSTYGGQFHYILIRYDKNDFIQKFQYLVNSDISNDEKIKKYRELFGIRKVFFDTLDLTGFRLFYTFKNINYD